MSYLNDLMDLFHSGSCIFHPLSMCQQQQWQFLQDNLIKAFYLCNYPHEEVVGFVLMLKVRKYSFYMNHVSTCVYLSVCCVRDGVCMVLKVTNEFILKLAGTV